MSNERAYDAFFGKLIRLLAELGLEMHTPMKGATYTCKRRPKQPRFPNRLTHRERE